MKRIVILLALLLLLVGCEKKENVVIEEEEAIKEISIFNRTYYDKKHMVGEGSIEELTLNSDNSVFYRKCVEEGTCSFFVGTFEIKEEKLYVTLTQQSKNNKWVDLSKKQVMEFSISDKNTFVSNTGGYEREFVLE